MGKRGVWRYGDQAVRIVLAALFRFTAFGDLHGFILWEMAAMFLLHLVWPLSRIHPWRETMPNFRTRLMTVGGICLLDLVRIAMFAGVARRSVLDAQGLRATGSTLLNAGQSRSRFAGNCSLAQRGPAAGCHGH
ncbi:MAG: hypothetical protein Q7K20_10320 [Polaromonas sp.]|nr:hypothetical protein [Polaromonas sp.]